MHAYTPHGTYAQGRTRKKENEQNNRSLKKCPKRKNKQTQHKMPTKNGNRQKETTTTNEAPRYTYQNTKGKKAGRKNKKNGV